LGSLLELYWPESLYEQLDPEGRYNNTFLALIALLKAESLRRPVILLLEDLQFIDRDTKDFLARLKRSTLAAEGAFPIAMIVTSRQQGASLEKGLIDARIILRGLSSEALGHLIETLLGGLVAPELISLVMDRSEGNPYFAEQIVLYLQEENLIETGQLGWTLVKTLDEDFVPGDVRAVLVARLDQLARGVRESVQTASVLGRQFEVPLLVHMLRDDKHVFQNVVEAEKASIWSPLDEVRYLFSHGLLRDAAYEMQMQARRRELHALAVDALERLYSDASNRYAEIAYHAKYAELGSKAQKYYILAGKSAAALYQNYQAIEYYKRALAFTPLNDLMTQFDILVERVELFNRVGNRTAQLKDLQTLEILARQLGDNARFATMLMLRAVYFYMIGNYLDAIGDASKAETLSESIAESDLAFLAQTTSFVALLRLGRLEESMERAHNTLQRVRGAGNRREEARVLNAMGQIALEQKEPASAEDFLTEALEIAREIKDRGMELRALSNLALCEASVKGNYVTARNYHEQTYKIARETGDRNAEGAALGNLGFDAGMQGDFVAAYQYHEQSLSVARETGNRYHETYTLINLSAITVIQNNASLGLRYAKEAAEIAKKVGERSGEAWALFYMGHAYALLNEFQNARQAYQRSVDIRNELDQPALSMEPLAGLVDIALRIDDLDTASREAEKIFAYLDRGGTLDGTDEPLRIFYTCYLFLKRQQDPRLIQVLQTANQLLETRSSRIQDEQARKMYIENVPWRHALKQAAKEINQQ
jgi:predicted ATPase